MEGTSALNEYIATTKLTVQMSTMSLEPPDNSLFKQVNLVELIREEIRTLGIEGNLLFHSEPTEDPVGVSAIESHAQTSYGDGLKYLHGSYGFPQNLKAAIREFTISSELGYTTAGVVLGFMKKELEAELQTNYYAGQLWHKGIRDGVQAAVDFRSFLEQSAFNFTSQDVPPNGNLVANSTNFNY